MAFLVLAVGDKHFSSDIDEERAVDLGVGMAPLIASIETDALYANNCRRGGSKMVREDGADESIRFILE